MADVKNYMVGEDEKTLEQIDMFAHSAAYHDSKIRIMPDAHAGKGAVVGSTMTFDWKIVPNTVGVDIACRVSAFPIDAVEVDLEKLDRVCHEVVPMGFAVRPYEAELSRTFPYTQLTCWGDLNNHERLRLSMGSLGGGNHYLELDKDEKTGRLYFVIHCGSRNLGLQVANYHQNVAIEERDERIGEYRKQMKEELREARETEHERLCEDIRRYWNNKINMEPSDDMCYLEDNEGSGTFTDYLQDMELCEEFSFRSHCVIFEEIAKKMGWEEKLCVPITSIHNYVDVRHGIIRKGAISAYEGEFGLIPLNMRDGILVVRGLGNEDWNCSLPHGAGRILSRSQAKKEVTLEEYEASMKGIYTTSVATSTLDESPMAYKDANAIIEAIRPNAEIVARLYPLWNCKAK